MKIVEIRQMSDAELKQRIVSEEETLGQLKFRLASKQLESPVKVRLVRRGIAKMKTVLRERVKSSELKK